jgi:serine/threonine protein kinase/predicted hydrocarbon binding protein
MLDQIGPELGPYRLIDKLGEGGAATIYRAYQPSMERYVAIKVLKTELTDKDPTFMERFMLEARTIAQLQHPHILPVIDFGRQENMAFLVMVLLEGGTLRTYLRENGALPLDNCAFMIAQIASALERAHSRGVIHRDLKPENILMDEDSNVYLTDFGIARILENTLNLTNTGAILGTPQYIAPEQARGKPADVRSDVYGLGVMLYEMTTGSLPFKAETPFGVLFKHISETPPAPRAIKQDLPASIEAVILKAMAKDPDERYQSALELAEAFVDAMPDAPKVSDQAEQRAESQPLGEQLQDHEELEEVTLHGYDVIPTTTPRRLEPQRASQENRVIINNRSDDENAVGMPFPNGYMHYAIRALEEVSGLQVTSIILRFAGLEDLLDNYPPNNMKFDQGYTFGDFANLNQMIVNYFGATGSEAIRHIGRKYARWMIQDQPMFGFTSAALRIMPTAAALRLALNRTADTWRKLWKETDYAIDIRVIEKPDFFMWAGRPCPCCAGKHTNAPICWTFEAGFIEGGILIKNKQFPVKQVACRAMGDPYCVWTIGKRPRDSK